MSAQLDVVTAGTDMHSGMKGGAVANPNTVLAGLLAGMRDPVTHRITVEGFYEVGITIVVYFFITLFYALTSTLVIFDELGAAVCVCRVVATEQVLGRGAGSPLFVQACGERAKGMTPLYRAYLR